MKAIYALYPDAESAERAINLLRAVELGIAPRDLEVLSTEPFHEHDFGRQQARTPLPWLAALGGLLGGAGGYWLAALSQESYPIATGGMPIVSPWTNGVVACESAMLGAILATLLTLLSSVRLPGWRRKLYDSEISVGKILVGVTNPLEDSRLDIEARLRDAGAHEVRQLPHTRS